MGLDPGTHLGPYEVLAPIGAGAMGEVYRARDTRLERTVAIKVLGTHIAERAEIRQRFEREARAVSSLNHPHICALYDVGNQDGQDFLVMEFLEGETLSHRLKRGAMAVDQVLRYSIQLAEALTHAHRQGIFHRDLKPGNIMLTRAGAKLLDFGLAKLRYPEGASPVGDQTKPDGESTLTVAGTIVGTVQYMAPEQLEGKPIDGRTDLFAFGGVLYEMVTGRKAFPGESTASVIAAILSSNPPPPSSVHPLPAGQPGAALDRVIQKCLIKDPDERWQTAQDLSSELKWIGEAGPLPAGRPGAERRPRRDRLAWTVAALAVVAAVVLGLALWMRLSIPERAVRFDLAPPENTALFGAIAISPDGKQVAFAAASADGKRSLWLRPLDSLESRPLPGTEGAMHPFWSPDSRFLGFFADGALKKIRVEGGPPQVLCSVFEARGGAWSPQGVIVFSPNDRDPLHRISDGGGASKPVTSLNPARQESSHQWPHFLPDGQHFLYLVWSAQADSRGIYVGSLDGAPPRRLVSSDWGVATARGPGSSYYLLFLRGTTLLGQLFDPKTLQLSGEPFPVAEHVWYDETIPGLTSFSVSSDGVLAFRSGGIRRTQLVWVDRSGKPLETVSPPGAYRDPWLSPDERRVVVAKLDPQTGTLDLWLLDWARNISSRLTSHPLNDGTPLWSPDGKTILFYSDREGTPNLYEKASSGVGGETLLWKSSVSNYPTGWTRDGRYVVYANWDPKTKWDLWVMPMFGDRKPTPYLQTEFDSFQAQFSPDGKWIAYVSNETNRYEVYVQEYPLSAARWQVSTGGGSQPSWRRDSHELYYLAPDRKLMAVEIKPGATFDPAIPKALFQAQVPGLVDARNHYIPAGDGKRFLVNSLVQETASSMTVAVNWTAGLKK